MEGWGGFIQLWKIWFILFCVTLSSQAQHWLLHAYGTQESRQINWVKYLECIAILQIDFAYKMLNIHKRNLPINRRDWSLVKTHYKASIMVLILTSMCAKSCKTLWTENLDRGSTSRRTLSSFMWAFVMESDFFWAISKSLLFLGCFPNSITHSVTPSA